MGFDQDSRPCLYGSRNTADVTVPRAYAHRAPDRWLEAVDTACRRRELTGKQAEHNPDGLVISISTSRQCDFVFRTGKDRCPPAFVRCRDCNCASSKIHWLCEVQKALLSGAPTATKAQDQETGDTIQISIPKSKLPRCPLARFMVVMVGSCRKCGRR